MQLGLVSLIAELIFNFYHLLFLGLGLPEGALVADL
jgi:hypothetical protein